MALVFVEHLENFKRLKELLELGNDTFARVREIAATRLVPEQGVVKWFRAPQQSTLKTVIALLLLSSLAKLVLWTAGEALHVDPTIRAFALSRSAIYVVEAVLVIPITIYITRKGSKEALTTNAVLSRGLRAENQFFRYWPLLWLSWFGLYFLLGYDALHHIQSPLLSVALNALNNLSGVFIFAMFYELTERTTRGSVDGQLVMPVLMCLAFLAGGETLCYSRSFPVGTAPERIQAWQTGTSYIFQLLSGIVVGVFTGLLVARLTSRLFNLPLKALAALTLFAVIQPVFPVLTAQGDDLSRGIAYAAAFVALYAKVILLIVIEWLRDRHGILYYMVNQARLFDDERERRMSESFQLMADSLLGTNFDGLAPPPDITPAVPSNA
jgi:hypothetical protein